MRKIVATYQYVGEQGELLFETVRYDPKDFSQRRPDGKDGWLQNLEGVPRVPYRLPELLKRKAKGHTIFVCEGEKDCAAVRGLGFCATTNAGGAEWQYTPEFIQHFRGAKRIVVIHDCDDSGRRGARKHAEALAAVCDDTRIVDLDPQRSDKYDVSDWIAAGHGAKELMALVEAAQCVEPAKPAEPLAPFEWADATGKRLNLIDLRDVRFERVEWFERNMIPRAELTLANGDGGIGKTTAVLDLLARASAGKAMPSGLQHDKCLRVLVVAEEDRHGLIRARLEVAGANFNNVRLVESVGEERDWFLLPQHAGALGRAIEDGDFHVVLIDALLNHFDDEISASKPQQMRRALRPLVEVAHGTGATIIAIRHIGKANGPAKTRGFGSAEARNLCRSELTLGEVDPESHPGLIGIALSKANLSPDHSATMAFRLESVAMVDDDGKETTVAAVKWERTPQSISADDLLSRDEPVEQSKTDAAADWLRSYLAKYGEVRATDVCDAGVKVGHSQATLYRARRKANVVSEMRGFPAQATWFLKEALDSQRPTIGELDNPGSFENPGQGQQSDTASKNGAPAEMESPDEDGAFV